MNTTVTGMLVLCTLLVPVSCQDVFFTEPVTCYFLDGFLFIYCIAATALYFREKFSFIPPEEGTDEEKERIYQELERPKDSDIYHILKQTKGKGKKKAGKKKKGEKQQDQQRSLDQSESLVPSIPLQTPAPR